MRLRRVAAAIVLAPCLAFAAFEAFVWTHRGDAPPVDDADLASRWQPAPDAENGRVRLLAAERALVGSEDTIATLRELRRTGEWDAALASAHLAANGAAVAVLDAAVEAPVYQRSRRAPPEPSAIEIAEQNADALGLMGVHELCVNAAVDRAHAGAGDAALDRFLQCLRLVRREATMPGAATIDVIGAVGMQGATVRALGGALGKLTVPAAESRRRERELDAVRIGGDAWRNAWAEDYRETSGHLAFAAAQEPAGIRRWIQPGAYSLHPNRGRAILAGAVRKLRDSADRPCTESARVTTPRRWSWHGPPAWMGERAQERWWAIVWEAELATPNGTGKFLVDLTTSTWERTGELRCQAATLPGVASALIALRAHRLERGALPPSLEALVPAYLSRVPIDGWDGAPLRYSREKRLLWSVGDDLRDDGGTPPPGAGAHAEPSWPIRF